MHSGHDNGDDPREPAPIAAYARPKLDHSRTKAADIVAASDNSDYELPPELTDEDFAPFREILSRPAPIAAPANPSDIAAPTTADDTGISAELDHSARLPYPINDLGPALAAATRFIIAESQCAPELAAQVVLAAASLAAQGVANVVLSPPKRVIPLSLFLTTVADSGERKTTAEKMVMSTIAECEREFERERRELAATQVPGEPPPMSGILTIQDPTVEALIAQSATLRGSIGIITSEAGIIVDGPMSHNMVKMGAFLSVLWDGEPYKHLRASSPPLFLAGRRLTVHFQMQPHVADKLMSKETLRDQGLFGRILFAAPRSLAGTRTVRHGEGSDQLPDAKLEAAFALFLEHLKVLIRTPPRLLNPTGPLNELDPRHLSLTASAQKAHTEALAEFELGQAHGGGWEEVKPSAARAGEQIARIAGIMTLVADPNAEVVDEVTVLRATNLVQWYLHEARRLLGKVAHDNSLGELLEMWARDQARHEFSIRDIQRLGPPILRKSTAAQGAIRELLASKHIEFVEGTRYRLVSTRGVI